MLLRTCLLPRPPQLRMRRLCLQRFSAAVAPLAFQRRRQQTLLPRAEDPNYHCSHLRPVVHRGLVTSHCLPNKSLVLPQGQFDLTADHSQGSGIHLQTTDWRKFPIFNTVQRTWAISSDKSAGSVRLHASVAKRIMRACISIRLPGIGAVHRCLLCTLCTICFGAQVQ